MITYELAKQIKDAGFPQKISMWSIVFFEGISFNLAESSNFKKLEDKEKVLIPTLSELIEACGDKFHTLERVVLNKTFWAATGKSQEGKYFLYKGMGAETPEETVANLWLVINNK